ncbi:hypothetical protein C8D87_11757 [Lentzea atacamensis]|uniref:Uncharacterized protein n=1 Tax=Lentzea atacamensis TaxID=531938 RepID=A0ABX9DWR0_9PSEU|nr:hypothetical protein C8D87_11757 [Lentzea atacamensis]
MSVSFVRVPTQTVQDCRDGCDLKTVLVDPRFR